MKGLAISLSDTKDAVNPQRTSSPRVGRSTHSRSHHGGSWRLVLLLLFGATLFNTPTAAAQSVGLTWTASTSAVSGYNVYRGNQTGGPYTMVSSSLVTGTAYTDATVQSGQS
jgi:hypothetical protein